jgi:uncharacterized protein (DUF2062 family)
MQQDTWTWSSRLTQQVSLRQQAAVAAVATAAAAAVAAAVLPGGAGTGYIHCVTVSQTNLR